MLIGKRAYKVLKEISYERLGGTKEELSALEVLKREVEALGIETEIEEFEVNSYSISSCEFKLVIIIQNVYRIPLATV